MVGGEIASEEQLCQVTGMLIHYFTLTSMLWLAIASSIIHHKLVNPTDKPIRHANPYVVNPEVNKNCSVDIIYFNQFYRKRFMLGLVMEKNTKSQLFVST